MLQHSAASGENDMICKLAAGRGNATVEVASKLTTVGQQTSSGNSNRREKIK